VLSSRWLLNDLIAGLTVGLMLIPQGLSYAKLAGIPVQYGLMSSWLPSAIYAFMGTSKGEHNASSQPMITALSNPSTQTYPLGPRRLSAC
jgi:MFS superfamily sulfate permease-like transporter